MPRNWLPETDFYFIRMGDDPVGLSVDMAAITYAPLSSHPARLRVVVHMKQPRPDGLRSSEELDALVQVEEALVEALAPLDAIHVGRVMLRGVQDIVFYAPPVAPSEVAERVGAALGDYDADLKVEPDPNWSFYRELLYPNLKQHHAMLNRRVLLALARNGDRHSLPRRVNHEVSVADADAAAELAEVLRARGFFVEPPRRKADGRLHLDVHRQDTVEQEHIDHVVWGLLDLVAEHGGAYDGWGCAVTTL